MEKQMIPFKKYLAQQLIGQTLHFTCNCIINMDVTGKVVDYEISGTEIVFLVDVSGKIMKIGENHPNLNVKKLET